MKMLDFYRSILEDANMSVSMDGYVSVTPIKGGSNLPATIDNKRLVLPTQEILMNADKNNVMVFHPLYENIMGAESEVMTKLRKCYAVKLETVLASISHRLLEICCTVPEHKRLNPEQSEALRQSWREGKYSSKVDLAKAFGISRQAVYRYLRRE